jgi:hypothetical protein
MAAVTYQGRMVDTPVYDNATTILAIMDEIAAFDPNASRIRITVFAYALI